MKLASWMLSLGLIGCLDGPAQVVTEVASASPAATVSEEVGGEACAVSAQGDVDQRNSKKVETRPRLKISDVVWDKTQVCEGGECATALKVNREAIVQQLGEGKWYCCCKGTIEDSPGGCQCASKNSCTGCNC